jgi:hypothetical protein
MQPAGLIVCERTRRWTAALRLTLRESGDPPRVALRQTRALAEADDALKQAPGSVVAVEVAAESLGETLRWIAQLERGDRAARAVALAAPDVLRHEWALREAGAALVLSSPRRAQSLIDLLAWHLPRVPPPTTSDLERIWNTLPWNEST